MKLRFLVLGWSLSRVSALLAVVGKAPLFQRSNSAAAYAAAPIDNSAEGGHGGDDPSLDVLNLLTQRALQTQLYYLKDLRDEPTGEWLRSFLDHRHLDAKGLNVELGGLRGGGGEGGGEHYRSYVAALNAAEAFTITVQLAAPPLSAAQRRNPFLAKAASEGRSYEETIDPSRLCGSLLTTARCVACEWGPELLGLAHADETRAALDKAPAGVCCDAEGRQAPVQVAGGEGDDQHTPLHALNVRCLHRLCTVAALGRLQAELAARAVDSGAAGMSAFFASPSISPSSPSSSELPPWALPAPWEVRGGPHLSRRSSRFRAGQESIDDGEGDSDTADDDPGAPVADDSGARGSAAAVESSTAASAAASAAAWLATFSLEWVPRLRVGADDEALERLGVAAKGEYKKLGSFQQGGDQGRFGGVGGQRRSTGLGVDAEDAVERLWQASPPRDHDEKFPVGGGFFSPPRLATRLRELRAEEARHAAAALKAYLQEEEKVR
mmetsp:Transcript_10032/g.20120  ORF Transcript_10032/g.20120 Transcript_10032/m.20120 type:complete len:495 (-) Transcript_10032:70-1554(-)